MNQFDFDYLAVDATVQVQKAMAEFMQAWLTRPATESAPPVVPLGMEGLDGEEETVYRPRRG